MNQQPPSNAQSGQTMNSVTSQEQHPNGQAPVQPEPTASEASTRLRKRSRLLGSVSLIALIALCVAWELFVAPIRPGGSWLVLKVIPLLLIVPGVLKGRVRTYQKTSLLVWLYFAEAATRVSSDPALESRIMAGGELLLSLLLFVAAAGYARSWKAPKQTSKGTTP